MKLYPVCKTFVVHKTRVRRVKFLSLVLRALDSEAQVCWTEACGWQET